MTRTLEGHLQRQRERSRGFFWHRVRWHAVSSFLPAGAPFTLLDVGAGAGLAGDWLARDFPQAVYQFAEPIPSLRATLAARFGAAADRTDSRESRGADVVLLLDVLEHQPDDRAFLVDLLSRMRPGALLLLTVPALPALWTSWDEGLGHHRRYLRGGLSDLAASLPLDLRELSYFFPEMVPVGILRKLRRALPLPPGGEGAGLEFPDLPSPIDDLLTRLGRATWALRRWWPLGSSLLLAGWRR
jgi:SAM-dependent methyltransferase